MDYSLFSFVCHHTAGRLVLLSQASFLVASMPGPSFACDDHGAQRLASHEVGV